VELIDMVEDGKLSFSTASQQIFPQLLENPSRTALDLATELGLLQVQDDALIVTLASEVLSEMPEKVEEYRAGKKGILGLFVGQVMRRGGGKLDPKAVSSIVEKALEG
jgi:aspartyl-tRNA(Asn)/glutamyl-tRNA(Gln) amidotransferase subunit B